MYYLMPVKSFCSVHLLFIIDAFVSFYVVQSYLLCFLHLINLGNLGLLDHLKIKYQFLEVFHFDRHHVRTYLLRISSFEQEAT